MWLYVSVKSNSVVENASPAVTAKEKRLFTNDRCCAFASVLATFFIFPHPLHSYYPLCFAVFCCFILFVCLAQAHKRKAYTQRIAGQAFVGACNQY